MRLSKTQIIGFQEKIFTWWLKNKRDLPWRHTHDPYKIFISEVMLQQTQVLRVLAKYREFIERYPTVTDLSLASTADVLRAWKGMGYNRRALYLKRTAEAVVKKYNGIFPTDEASLRLLPGIGVYTAGAIRVFAYKSDVSMVDTNIRKIITHFFFKGTSQKEAVILFVARRLVPEGKSWQWHQALMDYGALVMAKTTTSVRQRGEKKSIVPFKSSDRYFRGKILDDLRVKPEKMHALKKRYSSNFSLSDEKIASIFDKLKKDGLIEVTRSIVHLPR